jgi:hypothetical protein
MKKILLSLAAASFLFVSCSKDDDNSDYVSNTWVVNGLPHDVVNTARVGGDFTITINDGTPPAQMNSLTLFFSGTPVSGVYNIVELPTQPGEVGVLVQERGGVNLFRSVSNGESMGQLRVAVDGGKATVYMAGASLTSVLPGGGQASVGASFRENR